jgi:CrcB protein
MKMILAVALGGALGSVGRYVIAGTIMRSVGGVFPWGTLAVNVIGGLIMGALIELMALAWSPTPALRAFLTVGLLGGFTTFSAFSLETATMIERGAWGPAGAYVATSVIASIGGLFAGLWLVRALVPVP